MLVLSRKEREVIKVGDSITIAVIKISDHSISIGVEAPKNVKILRGELTKK